LRQNQLTFDFGGLWGSRKRATEGIEGRVSFDGRKAQAVGEERRTRLTIFPLGFLPKLEEPPERFVDERRGREERRRREGGGQLSSARSFVVATDGSLPVKEKDRKDSPIMMRECYIKVWEGWESGWIRGRRRDEGEEKEGKEGEEMTVESQERNPRGLARVDHVLFFSISI